MLTTNIAEMTARIDAHRAADLLVQGSYYDPSTGKGCFIGCLAHDNRPSVLADRYGIPFGLTRVLEGIFESLPAADAAEFFSAIPRAIGEDGKDLRLVVWRLLAEILRGLPSQPEEIQKVIDPVIAGMDALAEGGKWPSAPAAAAAAAARTAAAALLVSTDVAAWAAARKADAAAWAAAWAADAAAAPDVAASAAMSQRVVWMAASSDALLRPRDLILRLMREAPVIERAG